MKEALPWIEFVLSQPFLHKFTALAQTQQGSHENIHGSAMISTMLAASAAAKFLEEAALKVRLSVCVRASPENCHDTQINHKDLIQLRSLPLRKFHSAPRKALKQLCRLAGGKFVSGLFICNFHPTKKLTS